jgi:hypothetical protein
VHPSIGPGQVITEEKHENTEGPHNYLFAAAYITLVIAPGRRLR